MTVIRSIFRKQQGQSLIQALMSMALISILIIGFATLFMNQQRETRALSEKLAAMDLEKLLIGSLADGSVCAYVLNHPTILTFDSTKLPQTITLPSVPGQPAALYTSIDPGPKPGPVAAQAGAPASQVSDSLIVQSIQLQVTSGKKGRYYGDWIVSFDNTTDVRALKPLQVANLLIVDDTTSPTKSTVTACQGIGGNVGRFQLPSIVFPGQPAAPDGGWIALNQGSYPTVDGQYSAEFMSKAFTYTPQGTRVLITVQAGSSMSYTNNGQGLAFVVNLHYQPSGGADTPIEVGRYWAPPTTAGIGYAMAGDFEYHTVIYTTPGVSETFRMGVTVYCNGGCPNAAAALAKVWSPIGLMMQEYY